MEWAFSTSFQAGVKLTMSLSGLEHFTTDNSCQITSQDERIVGVKKKHWGLFQEKRWNEGTSPYPYLTILLSFYSLRHPPQPM